jgi:hypothetical protein
VVAQPDSVTQKEKERADRRGPHGGDRREKRRHDQSAQTEGENVLCRGHQGVSSWLGRVGSSGP